MQYYYNITILQYYNITIQKSFFVKFGCIFHYLGKTFQLTYSEWNQKIQANFEAKFWVPSDVCKETNKLVNRAGIYKDSFGATQFWADYQLRCNFPIAMVVVSSYYTLCGVSEVS